MVSMFSAAERFIGSALWHEVQRGRAEVREIFARRVAARQRMQSNDQVDAMAFAMQAFR